MIRGRFGYAKKKGGLWIVFNLTYPLPINCADVGTAKWTLSQDYREYERDYQ
jgi:hypothetical protein